MKKQLSSSFRHFQYCTLGTFAIIALAACKTTTVATHGQIVQERHIERLHPGVTTQDQVRRLLGSPSTVGTFNDNRWYYLTATTSSAPLNTNVLKDRRIVIVEFDQDRVVSRILTKTEEDGKEVPFQENETPTQGQSRGVLNQMLDNLGKGF
ncbi:MAG: outer membrane protein assembly factor BamE [Alphaproteobacteria bacterium]|nr:outer membrane protein assembly factor BamE [Alphaproteobacteria bacterium]MDD9919950.1 outer membrane protein assembly factor BamE [Alphaproteobacteria bacterium]